MIATKCAIEAKDRKRFGEFEKSKKKKA